MSSGLEKAARVVEQRKREFIDRLGSVEITVASDHPFAKAGLSEVHGVRVHVADGIVIASLRNGEPDLKLSGSLMYFHSKDTPGVGSQAPDSINADEED